MAFWCLLRECLGFWLVGSCVRGFVHSCIRAFVHSGLVHSGLGSRRSFETPAASRESFRA